MEKLGLKSKDSFKDDYLNPALESGLIKILSQINQLVKIECITKIN